ncbi:MAG TPA: energy transducer TonB, partial [Opitutaceae bacterium]
EVEELRRDDAELAKLRDEVASLQKQHAARTDAAKAKTRAGEFLGPGAVLYSLGQLDRQPVPTRQPPPTYPHALRAAGERHEAVVEFAIDAEGLVREVKALRSTHPDIATAAVEGVSRWQFQPGEKDGAKVNVRMQMPIVFKVSKEATKVEPWF